MIAALYVATNGSYYGLDGVGNRTTVAGGPAPGSYVLDAATPSAR